MNKGTTIQINSLEALERLIGGETELEISIRNSVVQNFANKHLKAVVNESITKKSAEAAIAESEKLFFSNVGSQYSPKYVLNETVRKKIAESVDYELKQAIRQAVYDSDAYKNMQTHIEEAAKWIVEDLTQSNLEKRLNILVDARLKERLGIGKS